MAIVKLPKIGYGQIELNQVAWRRDGRIEATCALNKEEFPANATKIGSVAENGMLFAINRAKRELTKATADNAAYSVIGINYSTEHLYDERLNGSYRHFYLHGGDTFLPRLGLLSAGDSFHTNTACYDDEKYADLDALKDAINGDAPVFAGIATDGSGYWEICDAAPAAGPVARVVEYADMPDGQVAVKLYILKA